MTTRTTVLQILGAMLLPYAATMGSVPLRCFAFTWGDRDLLVIRLGTAATLGLARDAPP